jgi:23S rRNA A2030 N6-methylase RlmJ
MPIKTKPAHHCEYRANRLRQLEAQEAQQRAEAETGIVKLHESLTAEITKYATPFGTDVLRNPCKRRLN